MSNRNCEPFLTSQSTSPPPPPPQGAAGAGWQCRRGGEEEYLAQSLFLRGATKTQTKYGFIHDL